MVVMNYVKVAGSVSGVRSVNEEKHQMTKAKVSST